MHNNVIRFVQRIHRPLSVKYRLVAESFIWLKNKSDGNEEVTATTDKSWKKFRKDLEEADRGSSKEFGQP